MTSLDDVVTQKSFKYLEEIETIGQQILTLKDQKIKIANAQNKAREAYRALELSEDRYSWMQFGLVQIQRPTEECKSILKAGNYFSHCDLFKLQTFCLRNS